jgi:hypothetical protein
LGSIGKGFPPNIKAKMRKSKSDASMSRAAAFGKVYEQRPLAPEKYKKAVACRFFSGRFCFSDSFGSLTIFVEDRKMMGMPAPIWCQHGNRHKTKNFLPDGTIAGKKSYISRIFVIFPRK